MRSIGVALMLVALFGSCRPAAERADPPRPPSGPVGPAGGASSPPGRERTGAPAAVSAGGMPPAAPPDAPTFGKPDVEPSPRPGSSDQAAAEGVSPAAAAPLEDRPGLVRLSPVGGLWIDPAAKEVIVAAKVVLTEGPIELFACPAKTKEYESILAVDPLEARLDPPTIDAMASLLGGDPKSFKKRVGARLGPAELIHTALVLVGLAPGQPVAFVPDYRPATGSAVRVRVRFRAADGTVETSDARDWIRDIRTGGAMEAGWVFAGSGFSHNPTTGEDRYDADAGDLICVSNFQTAMLDLPVPSAQSNEALVFEIMPGRVPAKGTPVEIVLSADASGPSPKDATALTPVEPEPRQAPPQGPGAP